MPFQKSDTTAPGDQGEQANDSSDLTPEQLARLAELVADGETDLPDDLATEQLEQLIELVRRRRRARLVRFIARQIAADIRRGAGEKNRR